LGRAKVKSAPLGADKMAAAAHEERQSQPAEGQKFGLAQGWPGKLL